MCVEKYYVTFGIARSLAAAYCYLAFGQIGNILAGLQPWGVQRALSKELTPQVTLGEVCPGCASKVGIAVAPRCPAGPWRSKGLERRHPELSPPCRDWVTRPGRCAGLSTCGMSWKWRQSSFWQGMCSSAKGNALGLALPKVMAMSAGFCVFLVSAETECCYIFWMVGICMITKTST